MMQTKINFKNHVLLVWALIMTLVAGLVSYGVFIWKASPTAPYMDSLRILTQLYEFVDGKISLFQYWNQWQHHGLIAQALLAVNVFIFGYRPILANISTGFVVAAVFAIIGTMFLREIIKNIDASPRRKQNFVPYLFIVFCGVLLFTYSGWGVFTLDFGLALWVKNLSFILFYAAYDRLIINNYQVSIPRLVLLAIAGFGIVAFIAMGWGYAFVATVIAVELIRKICGGLDKISMLTEATRLIVAATLVMGAMLYYFVGGGLDSGGSGAFSVSVMNVGKVLYALGSTWIGVDAYLRAGLNTSWIGAFGFITVCMIFFCLALFRKISSPNVSWMPVFLIIYGSLTATAVSLARGSSGAESLMASRYYMDYAFVVIGCLWILTKTIAVYREPDVGRFYIFGSKVFLVVCTLIIAGQLYTSRVELAIAPYRADAFVRMNKELCSGATGPDAQSLLQSPLNYAQDAASLMKRHHLGPFHGCKN